MKELSGKKYRTLCMKRLITVMLISIAVIRGWPLWSYEQEHEDYGKEFGFDAGELDRLAAAIDRAEAEDHAAQEALTAAKEDLSSCEKAAKEDKKNNKPKHSCSGKATAVKAAEAAADKARRALQSAIAAYRDALKRNLDKQHNNRVDWQKQLAVLHKIQQIEARLGIQ